MRKKIVFSKVLTDKCRNMKFPFLKGALKIFVWIKTRFKTLPGVFKIAILAALGIGLFFTFRNFARYYLGAKISYNVLSSFPHRNDKDYQFNEFALLISGILSQTGDNMIRIEKLEAELRDEDGKLLPCKLEVLDYDTLRINALSGIPVIFRNLKALDMRRQVISGGDEIQCNLYFRVAENMYRFIRDSKTYKLDLSLYDTEHFRHHTSEVVEFKDQDIMRKH